MFAKLDTNGDKKIDLVELQAGAPADGKGKDAAAILKEADTSGDGTIDATENEAFLSKMDSQAKPSGAPPSGPPPGGAHPAKGGSGAGSSEASTNKVYDSRDTNQDGVVSLQELLAAEDKESLKAGIQDLLKTLTVNAQSYDEQGNGNIDATGGVVDTVV
jgi:Ca2+-binding EF-hand superfamily protein